MAFNEVKALPVRPLLLKNQIMTKFYAIRKSTPIYLWTIILCSFLFAGRLHAQPLDIAGTYTIDPSGGAFDPGVNDNFLSFNEAVDTLISRGIGGAVTINVADGLYNEAFTITAIPGAGAVNTVTFQSASADSSAVYLNFDGYNADTTSVIKLEGADYITFRHLGFDLTPGSTSYGQGILITGDCQHISFENNLFIGKTNYSSYTDNRAIITSTEPSGDFLEFRNNRFTLGENGIKLYGPPGTQGIVIEDNVFVDQVETALHLEEMDAPVIRDNYISNLSYTGKGGIYLYKVLKGFEVAENIIEMDNCNTAIRLEDCSGNPGDEGMIYNNFISNKGSGTSYNHGFYLDNTTYTNVYHNSVYQHSGWAPNSRAFYQNYGGNNLKVMNNSFQNSSGGYALFVDDAASIHTSDYNNYFTNGNFIAHWEDAELETLADLRSANSKDAASVSVNPWHNSETDLHTTSFRLESMGTDLTADVPLDIDGEVRSATPDIGADEFTGAGVALSGDYYIGGTSPDYTSLQEAANDLSRYGVSGPVNLYLRDADSPYEAYADFEPIAGASETNTITLQPDPANTGNVILVNEGTSANNYTLMISRGNHLSIHDLVMSAANENYSTVLRIRGYTKNVTVKGCTLNSMGTSGSNAAIYAHDVVTDGLTIDSCVFTGGTRGVEVVGLNNTNKSTDVVITDSEFSDHYYSGVYLEECNAPEVTSNHIQMGSTHYNYWGIQLDDCYDDYRISGNTVLVSEDDGGIYVYGSTGSSTFTGNIINNYVEAFAGTGEINGIRLYNSTYINVYFNTCRIFEGNTSTTSNAFNNSGGSNIRIKNNNFVNFGSGRAYYNATSSAILESDYNNLFSAGFTGHWAAVDYFSLEDLKSASGLDEHSISFHPWFLDEGEPDINSSYLDGQGVAISGVTLDINGETRQDPPDIGAAEFTATLQPLAEGSYTIGGDSPDYPSITDAFADIQNRGISGPVTINIRTGIYNEIVPKLLSIPGAGPESYVTVKSETGNPSDVTLYFQTTSSPNSSDIINLSGVSYFTLRDMTISAQGTSYGRAIAVGENYNNVEIINCILTSANTSYPVLELTGIGKNVTIEKNTISGGSDGIYFECAYNNHGTGNVVRENEISGNSNHGIWMEYHQAPHIIGNKVENLIHSGFTGIYCQDCSDKMIVSGNIINNLNTDYGISLEYCKAAAPFNGLVSNNSIHNGGTYYATGIYVDGCNRTLIYNNSVHVSSTHSSYGRGIITTTSNSEIEIVNNVIANTGPGYAMLLYDLADIAVTDYNNLYASGENLVSANNTEYADLAAWQSAGSYDQNSISANPLFYSDQDLHSNQALLHEAATPLAMVTHDLDSVERDPAAPDIGAYEFTCVSPTFNVWFSEACLGDSTVFIDSSLNIAGGSSRGWDMNGDLVADLYTHEDLASFKYEFEETGTHTVTYIVQQIAGCNDFISLEVPVTPTPVFTLETSGAYCDTADGTAVVDVTNMEGPFLYYWSNGSTDSIAENLDLGTYSVTVSTLNGCAASQEFEIGEAIEVNVTPVSAATCGQSNGSATVSATGGVAPYTYVWSNDLTGTANDSLPPGMNYVNVTDALGCAARAEVLIDNDGGPQITLESVQNNNCYGEKTGSINISVSGGTEPYEILWSNGADTEDLTGLAAGIYNVTVTDASGCPASGSFEVVTPTPLYVSSDVTPSSCLGSDGNAIVNVTGGTSPYSYEWDNGSTERIASGLEAGVYTVTITDDNGCELVEPVIIGNVDAPVVTVESVQGVTCGTTNTGAIDISVLPLNPFNDYSWSSGQTDQDVSGLAEGTYEVTVTDEAGCKGFAQVTITQEPPPVQEICIVTVDTAIGKNLVFWEKDVTAGVSHYNVYRESTIKGQYEVIGSVPVDQEGIFIDSTADPRVRSWRYKLSVVDVCGNESELSPHHKTMHLTINTGIENTINLIWDNYEGFEVGSYDVWRLDPDQDWQKVTEIPSNLFTYTDLEAPAGVLDYYIEVEHPTGCTTEKKASSLNSSRSNRKTAKKTAADTTNNDTTTNDTTGVGSLRYVDPGMDLNIYPNPGTGKYQLDLQMEQSAEVRMQVYDMSGRMIMNSLFEDPSKRLQAEFDLSDYADGLYQVRITTRQKLIHRIIIKE